MSKGQVLIVGGPAGCGKSTVAGYLAAQLGWAFIEGDTLHPTENIAKMSNGIPLTDADRWSWLGRIVETATVTLEKGKPGVVLTCSALKRAYRDVLRKVPSGVDVTFVFLLVDQKALLDRVRARKDHYMKVEMVESQLRDLEVPQSDETDVVDILIKEQDSPDNVSQSALKGVRAKLKMP